MFFPFVAHDVLLHLLGRWCVRDSAIGSDEVAVDLALRCGYAVSPHTVFSVREFLAFEPVTCSIQSMCHE